MKVKIVEKEALLNSFSLEDEVVLPVMFLYPL